METTKPNHKLRKQVVEKIKKEYLYKIIALKQQRIFYNYRQFMSNSENLKSGATGAHADKYFYNMKQKFYIIGIQSKYFWHASIGIVCKPIENDIRNDNSEKQLVYFFTDSYDLTLSELKNDVNIIFYKGD